MFVPIDLIRDTVATGPRVFPIAVGIGIGTGIGIGAAASAVIHRRQGCLLALIVVRLAFGRLDPSGGDNTGQCDADGGGAVDVGWGGPFGEFLA